MRKPLSILTLFVVLLAAQLQTSVAQKGDGARLANQVSAISAGADTKARGTAIKARLDALGIKYRTEPFMHADRQGENIVAEIPPQAGATKQLMLGAHYDRVSQGQGAIDNASGSLAVLELLAALKKKPLKNYAVFAAFFDLEEIGLRGSENYIKAREGKPLPAVFINFDVFGYGDTLWVMTPDEKSASATAVKTAAAKAKFPLQIGAQYPASDHRSFIRAKVETLSFSLIDGKEIPSIIKFSNREVPDQMPRVMTIIHSPNDTPDKIDGAAIARALPVVGQAIRLMDK
ncbi:MAG TPA: M28 family peptidase [Pyrinomonadaceae bacterium]|nr:M28 family peptidase [Pyrinomonadaceae bacterium]